MRGPVTTWRNGIMLCWYHKMQELYHCPLGYLLYHVENRLVLPQPDVMVRYGHLLKVHALGVLEEGVWPPDFVQPFGGQWPGTKESLGLPNDKLKSKSNTPLACSHQSCFLAAWVGDPSRSEQRTLHMCKSGNVEKGTQPTRVQCTIEAQ